MLFFTLCFSYEKGYIDTHGGKENSIVNEKIYFLRQGVDFLLKNKTIKSNDSNKSQIKHIKIDDIQKIKF